MESVLRSALNGQNIDHVVLNRENRTVAWPCAYTNQLFTNLKCEICVFCRKRVTFRRQREFVQLFVDRVFPMNCLLVRVMFGPPKCITPNIFVGTVGDFDLKFHFRN